MKTRSLKKLSYAFLLFASFLALSQSSVFAQACPVNGAAQVGRIGWQKGATVSVFIDPSVTGDARRATEQAFTNWNGVSGANNSGVTYTFTSTRPTSGVGTYIIVNYGTNLIDVGTGQQVRAQARTTIDSATGITKNAGIIIDQVMTNYDAVLEAMVHEIGHPAGFDHCTGSGCTPTNSVMTLVVPSGNPAAFNQAYGRATSPTACDNQTLKSASYPNCFVYDYACEQYGGIWNANTCTCETYGGGGITPEQPAYQESCTHWYRHYYRSWDGGRTWYENGSPTYVGCW